MSAILLTYSNQRETSLKEQEKATQPSASVAASVQFVAQLRSWIWVQGEKNCGVTEIMLRELGLLCPDVHSHTNRGGSGGHVLLSTEVKSRFICSDSRDDWEKGPASPPPDGVFAIIRTPLPPCLWGAEEARLLPLHECIHYDAVRRLITSEGN